MKTTPFLQIPLKRAALLVSLGLSLGIAACGSSPEPIGASEQPISADPDVPDGGSDAACADGVTPADALPGQCQVTARGLCFVSAETACACAGCGSDECALAESFPAQAVCPVTGGDSDPNGPVSDDSDPDAPVSSGPLGGGSPGHPGSGEQAAPGCGTPGSTDPAPLLPSACADGIERDAAGEQECNFVVDGACFTEPDSACACAGCELEQCLILESYPAQVACSS